MREITTQSKNIKRRQFYKLYNNEFNNLDEMNNFLKNRP